MVLVTGAVAATFVPLAPPARTSEALLGGPSPPHTSAKPPLFRIDVAAEDIGQGKKTPGTLEIVTGHDGGEGRAAAETSPTQLRIGIEVHGKSSVIQPKKSYEIELRDERGDDRALSLLGLPAHSDWVLHGCGRDDTCLRNALAYALARDIGRYAPRTRFLELYLDEEHHGLYVLVERIRRGAERVDLPKPSDHTGQGDISGGYIFKMDMAEGHPADAVPRDWVSPVSFMVYSYHYPRFDDITAAQKQYLHNHIAEFERMMTSSRWNDAAAGYRAWIDVPSWVDFALLQELSHNLDAYQASHYFQKWPRSRGNKIALGPVWDFDNAFGSTKVREAHRTDAWAHQMNRFQPGDPVPYDPPGLMPHVPAFWERLWTDPAFHEDLRCRWNALRDGPLHLDAITSRIDRLRSELALAQPRDDARWGIAAAYDERVNRLKTWVSARLAWMDGNLPGSCA